MRGTESRPSHAKKAEEGDQRTVRFYFLGVMIVPIRKKRKFVRSIEMKFTALLS
jgi:hypothetical protein